MFFLHEKGYIPIITTAPNIAIRCINCGSKNIGLYALDAIEYDDDLYTVIYCHECSQKMRYKTNWF